MIDNCATDKRFPSLNLERGDYLNVELRIFRVGVLCRQVHRPAAMDKVPNLLSIASGFIPDGLGVIET